MTDIITAMKNRHAVRAYDPEKKIPKEITDKLREKIDLLNSESGLHIQLVTDEPKAFDSFMAHYGKFSGVTDYIALIGRKNDKLNEICGYCGEQLVLLAAQLGLDSCWVAMSYAKVKNAYTIAKGEKRHCERCFSRTRHVLYQHMTAGKQGGNEHFHYVMLAYNDFFDLS